MNRLPLRIIAGIGVEQKVVGEVPKSLHLTRDRNPEINT